MGALQIKRSSAIEVQARIHNHSMNKTGTGLIPSSEIVLVFAACVFPIHAWAILNVLREVPAWVLRLTTWELIGVIAYTQAYALVESLVVLIILVFLGLLLPLRLYRNKFIANSTMIVLITTIWAVLAHYNDGYIRLMSLMQFFPWLGLYILSIGIGYLLVWRYDSVVSSIQAILERIMVLSFIYVFIAIFSVFVVIFRNIQGIF